MSPKVRRARAIFGWRGGERWRGRARAAAERIDRLLAPGEVALITGPSGSGKSRIGRALAARLTGAVSAGIAVPMSAARVLDLFESGLEASMASLARAGLAEARAMLARSADLSEGERARLSIALAMEKVSRGGGTLIIDEFASTLDRPTAAALCRTVRRWACESGVRVVCITAHDDVLEWLGPEVLAVVGERTEVRRRGDDLIT
jgi:ABC-type ATPase with predicted acetyltransferase domain